MLDDERAIRASVELLAFIRFRACRSQRGVAENSSFLTARFAGIRPHSFGVTEAGRVRAWRRLRLGVIGIVLTG